MEFLRRDFLGGLAMSGAASPLSGVLSCAGAGIKKRPNILWIMTDQQFAGAMQCAGSRDVSTPALDSLARQGCRFDLAYCTQPICVPSRSSMMTGTLPHEVGVTFNHETPTDLAPVSAGAWLKAHGYATAYFGKWHIPSPVSNQAWHGFDVIKDHSRGIHDPDVTDLAVEYLENGPRKPFFMVLSLVNPHDICQWARLASGYRADSSVLRNGLIPAAPEPSLCPELPDNFGIPDHEPTIIREHQSWIPSVYPTRGWTDGQWRQYRWAYYRLIELADAKIGRLLAALKAQGLEDDTVVLFVSDHGDGTGAHHWNQKTLLYDETTRVPLIPSWKGRTVPGNVDSAHLVSTKTGVRSEDREDRGHGKTGVRSAH